MLIANRMTSEEDVLALTNMGFGRDAAVAALQKANNDKVAAVDLLVNPPAESGRSSAWSSYTAGGSPNNAVSTAIIPAQVDSNLHMPPLAHPLASKEAEDLEKAITASLQAFNSPATPSIPAISREDEDLNFAIEASLQGQDPNDLHDPNTRLRAPTMPVGLKNIGNTCYLNSLLQTYFFVPQFRHAVLSFQPPPAAPQSWSPSPPPHQASVNLVLELQALFGRLLLSERKEADPSGVMKWIVDGENKAVEIGPQQDMSEFNGTLLASLEHAFHPHPPPPHPFPQHYPAHSQPGSGEGSAALMPMHTSAEEAADEEPAQANVIKKLFFGDMVEEYLAQEADNTPTSTFKNDEFNHIILDVSAADLYRSLDLYSHAHIERYETRKHFVTKADKYVWFQRFPPVLIFQLQRVLYDPAKNGAYKVHDRFAFQSEIYLDRYLYRNRDLALDKRRLMAELSDHKERLEKQLKAFTHYDSHSSFTPNAQALPLDQALRASLQHVENIWKNAGQEQQPYAMTAQVLQHAIHHVESHIQKLQAEIDQVVGQMDQVYADMRTTKYRLHSVWVHDGEAGGGHYWAFLYNKAAKTWAKFSDANVTTVDEETVVRESLGGYNRVSAYCLIYVHDSMHTFTNDVMQPFRLDEDSLCVPPQLRRDIGLENKALQEQVRVWNEKAARFLFVNDWEKQVQMWRDAVTQAHDLDDLLLRGLEGFLVGLNETTLMECVVAHRIYRACFHKPFLEDAEMQSERYRKLVDLLKLCNPHAGSAVEAWCSPTLHRQCAGVVLRECEVYNRFAQLHIDALGCIIENNATPMVDKLLRALRHLENAWGLSLSVGNILRPAALHLRFTPMMHDLRICIWALCEEVRTMVSQGVADAVRVSLVMAKLVRKFIKHEANSLPLYRKIVQDWSELAETTPNKDKVAETLRILLGNDDDPRAAQQQVQDMNDVNTMTVAAYLSYPPDPTQSLHTTYLMTRKAFHNHSKISMKRQQVHHFLHGPSAPAPHQWPSPDHDSTTTPRTLIGGDMMQIDSTASPAQSAPMPSPSELPGPLPTHYHPQPPSYSDTTATTTTATTVPGASADTWVDVVTRRHSQSPDLMPGSPASRANKRPFN